MSRPCVPFNQLKMLVLDGPGMSHHEINRVWHQMLACAGITTIDKDALAGFSTALLDYRDANDGFYPHQTPAEVVGECFRASTPKCWVTICDIM